MMEDFEKLCTRIFYYNSKFEFPFDAIIHEEEFQDLLTSDKYPFLKMKMENLIDVLNQDPMKVYWDTQELWELI
jgi:hypothetical protein